MNRLTLWAKQLCDDLHYLAKKAASGEDFKKPVQPKVSEPLADKEKASCVHNSATENPLTLTNPGSLFFYQLFFQDNTVRNAAFSNSEKQAHGFTSSVGSTSGNNFTSSI